MGCNDYKAMKRILKSGGNMKTRNLLSLISLLYLMVVSGQLWAPPFCPGIGCIGPGPTIPVSEPGILPLVIMGLVVIVVKCLKRHYAK